MYVYTPQSCHRVSETGNFSRAVLRLSEERLFLLRVRFCFPYRESQMKRAMDKFRGRMMVVMMGLSFVGFYAMIVSGRKLREAGDSLTIRGTNQEMMWKEQGRLERLHKEEKRQE